MMRFLKTLLLWLLIAALPVQGLAAAVKATCGQAHHDGLMQVHHQHGDAGHEHHHDDHAGHDLTADEASPAPLHADGSPVSDDAGKQKSSYCSACAACCFGAFAPPPIAAWTSSYDSSEFVIVPHTTPFTGHIPAGIERPPRSISA